MVSAGTTDPDDPEAGEGDWACLSLADLKADLAACEEAAAPAQGTGRAGPSASARASEAELRSALQRGAAATSAALDADAFLSARWALHGVAAGLHEALVQTDTLQFSAASLAASLIHGPLRPPAMPESHGDDAEACLGAKEAFGPGAAPAAPPPMELHAPAGASGLPEYQQLLEGLPQNLFVGRRLRLCVGEVDRHQDEKDIGRDELVVNGEAISGSKGGYAAAHAAVVAALRAGQARDWPTEESVDRAAQLLLSVLNRTCSGFAAFEEVLRLFDCPDAVIVAPESAAARPLEAVILGGVALGRGHTRYAVRRADAGEATPLAVVDAVFAFRLEAPQLRRLARPARERAEGLAEGAEKGAEGGGRGGAWPVEEVEAAVLLCRAPPKP